MMVTRPEHMLRPLQEVLRPDALEALKHQLRKDPKIKTDSELESALGRFSYAVFALRIEPREHVDDAALFQYVNNAVINKKNEMGQKLIEGKIHDEKTKKTVAAFVEFINSKHIQGREWSAVTLSLDEPTPGLRIAPYVVKHLLTDENPIEVVRNHEKMVEKFSSGPAKLSYRGRVMKPDHVVHLVEEEMDYSTGEVKAMYFYTLFHFNRDSVIDRRPEYEPIWFKLEEDKNKKWHATWTGARIHWDPWKAEASEVVKADGGAWEITSVQDLRGLHGTSIPMGHGLIIVDRHFLQTYTTIRRNSLDFAGLKDIKNMGREVVLAIELMLSGLEYKGGRAYHPKKESVMEPKTEVFRERVRD